jgi:hypothetical protein
MSLLAEEIVEEWLNRKGYFTIRGIKLGVDEIDLIGLRKTEIGFEGIHVEVCVSMNPVSYISKVPKQVQKETSKGANSAARSREELEQGVKEFVENKFFKARKHELLSRLLPDLWSRELVVHKVKDNAELELIKAKASLLDI